MFGIEMRQWCKEIYGEGSVTHLGVSGGGGGGGERWEEQTSLNFPHPILLISTSNACLFKMISLNLMFPPSRESLEGDLPWNSYPELA